MSTDPMAPRQAAERFHEDGFVQLRGVFSAEEVARMKDELAAYIATVAPTLQAGDIFREDDGVAIKSMFRLDQRSPYFASLTRDQRLAELVAAIFPGEEVLPLSMSYFGKPAGSGSPAPAHQDNGFSFYTPPLALNFSIALDPHTLANGAMHCCRGSHRLGVMAHHPSGVKGFSQCLVAPIDETQYPALPCLMAPGDITLHHTNTVHYSGGNPSTISRRMLTTIFRGTRVKRDEARYAAIEAERLRLHGRVVIAG